MLLFVFSFLFSLLTLLTLLFIFLSTLGLETLFIALKDEFLKLLLSSSAIADFSLIVPILLISLLLTNVFPLLLFLLDGVGANFF